MYIIVAFLWFFQCSQECLTVFEKLLVWFFFFVLYDAAYEARVVKDLFV